MQSTFAKFIFIAILVTEGFFNHYSVANDLCTPKYIVPMVTLSILGVLLFLQCCIHCICFLCEPSLSTYVYCVLFVVLAVGQSVAVENCDDAAKYWAYGINGGLVLLIALLCCLPDSRSSDVAI